MSVSAHRPNHPRDPRVGTSHTTGRGRPPLCAECNLHPEDPELAPFCSHACYDVEFERMG